MDKQVIDEALSIAICIEMRAREGGKGEQHIWSMSCIYTAFTVGQCSVQVLAAGEAPTCPVAATTQRKDETKHRQRRWLQARAMAL